MVKIRGLNRPGYSDDASARLQKCAGHDAAEPPFGAGDQSDFSIQFFHILSMRTQAAPSCDIRTICPETQRLPASAKRKDTTRGRMLTLPRPRLGENLFAVLEAFRHFGHCV